jgi:hypothetical protein
VFAFTLAVECYENPSALGGSLGKTFSTLLFEWKAPTVAQNGGVLPLCILRRSDVLYLYLLRTRWNNIIKQLSCRQTGTLLILPTLDILDSKCGDKINIKFSTFLIKSRLFIRGGTLTSGLGEVEWSVPRFSRFASGEELPVFSDLGPGWAQEPVCIWGDKKYSPPCQESNPRFRTLSQSLCWQLFRLILLCFVNNKNI